MREAWEWDEHDVESLIREQRKEDLRLEFKRSEALSKSDARKTEISKDVSAMANSAGGIIVYGVDEQKPNGPIRVDGGSDPSEVSPEWLEQVIDSGIQRRIAGVRVHAIPISESRRLVFVVWVPQSNLAPHMAADRRYYKRLGTTTAIMEEYEVRDVGHRLESPDLDLDLSLSDGFGNTLLLVPFIQNRSVEPALYATCRLYLERALGVSQSHGWQKLDDIELLWNERDRTMFQVFRYPWSIPERHPILEGEQYQLESLHINVGFNYRLSAEPKMYSIGWELRAPRAAAKAQGVKLIIDQRGRRVQGRYSLMKP